MKKSVEDRFWAKVVKTEGCWLWTGAKARGGYGQLRLRTQGGPSSAHRVSYEMFVGPIPEGLFVCHRCDVRSCVNPAHLFLGTFDDNMADMFEKGRDSKPPVMLGEENPSSKLTEKQAAEIKEKLTRCMRGTITRLAEEYDVDRKTIHNIKTGKIWKTA